MQDKENNFIFLKNILIDSKGLSCTYIEEHLQNECITLFSLARNQHHKKTCAKLT